MGRTWLICTTFIAFRQACFVLASEETLERSGRRGRVTLLM
jgi:hypothetical protein